MNLEFVVPCIFSHSNKTPNWMQQSLVKFYCFVVQTLLNMFRALLCPSSGARQTSVAASGFCMNVEVRTLPPPHSYGKQRLQRQFDGLLMMGIIMPETCWAVSVRQSNKILRLIVASSWVFYLRNYNLYWWQSQIIILKWHYIVAMSQMKKVFKEPILLQINTEFSPSSYSRSECFITFPVRP